VKRRLKKKFFYMVCSWHLVWIIEAIFFKKNDWLDYFLGIFYFKEYFVTHFILRYIMSRKLSRELTINRNKDTARIRGSFQVWKISWEKILWHGPPYRDGFKNIPPPIQSQFDASSHVNQRRILVEKQCRKLLRQCRNNSEQCQKQLNYRWVLL